MSNASAFKKLTAPEQRGEFLYTALELSSAAPAGKKSFYPVFDCIGLRVAGSTCKLSKDGYGSKLPGVYSVQCCVHNLVSSMQLCRLLVWWQFCQGHTDGPDGREIAQFSPDHYEPSGWTPHAVLLGEACSRSFRCLGI
eukprot:3738-Heterococcus_DN1.PRE.2